jgi:hypothetical protein
MSLTMTPQQALRAMAGVLTAAFISGLLSSSAAPATAEDTPAMAGVALDAGTGNPNQDRITAQSWWLMGQLLGLEPGTEYSGIYMDKPGYHNTRDGNAPGNYSVLDSADRGGPPDKAAAYDWTFPSAQRGDYTRMAVYGRRLLAAYNSRDPRMDGWREALGQTDTDATPEGLDIRHHTLRTPDATHRWHFHFSESRSEVESWDNKLNLLSVLRGDSPAAAAAVKSAAGAVTTADQAVAAASAAAAGPHGMAFHCSTPESTSPAAQTQGNILFAGPGTPPPAAARVAFYTRGALGGAGIPEGTAGVTVTHRAFFSPGGELGMADIALTQTGARVRVHAPNAEPPTRSAPVRAPGPLLGEAAAAGPLFDGAYHQVTITVAQSGERDLTLTLAVDSAAGTAVMIPAVRLSAATSLLAGLAGYYQDAHGAILAPWTAEYELSDVTIGEFQPQEALPRAGGCVA